jgi:F-type H+-transporting ATPase subunit b
VAQRSLGRLRPMARPVVGSLAQTNCYRRMYSTQDPKAKADEIVNSVPETSVLTKTGILATGAAAAAYAIGNSLYVINEETVLVVTFSAFVYLMSKTAAPAYRDWAEGYITNVKSILDTARDGHVVAVKERIETVEQLKDVVSVTKDLFAVSKDTVELEAQAFEQKQKVDFAGEAKSVLDSWVRYESQVRQREQQDLAKSVIENIQKEISNPKFQQQVLQQAVVDVESKLREFSVTGYGTNKNF